MTSPYQPYRQGAMRPNTSALHAMLLGKPLYLPNPIDQHRQLQKQGLLALLTGRR